GLRPFLLGYEGPGPGRDVLRRVAEVLEDDLPRSRCAEPVDGHGLVGPALPAKGRGGLDSELGHATGEHGVPVRLVLLLEQLPARHGHDAGRNARAGELLGRLDAHRGLAAGADEY